MGVTAGYRPVLPGIVAWYGARYPVQYVPVAGTVLHVGKCSTGPEISRFRPFSGLYLLQTF